jgi:hypothetical protein
MDINDYLIDHSASDWCTLLADWHTLLPAEFNVWLMNKFGKLFLVATDGTILYFNVTGWAIEKVAENKDEFCDLLNDDGNANYWLMIPLVDKMVAAGITLTDGRCYCFKIPTMLGGEYSVENAATISIEEHFRVNADLYEEVKDLPDGTKVELRVINVPT